MQDDEITTALRDLPGDALQPRQLSDDEKKQLIRDLGLKTTQNIIKAKKDFPLRRIPFLFSSLNPQWVVDVLHNDLSDALKEAEVQGGKNKAKVP